MSDTANKDKFDAVLARLIAAKPQTEVETKAKAEALRKTKPAKRKDSD